MKWRFIAVPMGAGAFGLGALMLVLHVFARNWDGPSVSPWIEAVAKWDSRVLLAPLNLLNQTNPWFFRRVHPFLATFIVYALIGVFLVAIWEVSLEMIRKRNKAEPATPPYSEPAARSPQR